MANKLLGFTNDVYQNIYLDNMSDFLVWAKSKGVIPNTSNIESYVKLFAEENPNLSIKYVIPEDTGSPYASSNPYIDQIGNVSWKMIEDGEPNTTDDLYFNKTPLWKNFSPSSLEEQEQLETWQLLMSDENFGDSLMSKTSQNNPNGDFNFKDLITQGYTLDYDPETGVGTLTDPNGQISTLQSVSSTIGDIDLNGDGKKLIFVPQSGNTTELDFLSVPTTQRDFGFEIGDDLEDKSKKDDDTVIDETVVIPSTVIDKEDNMIYKPLGEDLAGFLADEGDRWTPANGFLDAASIVNPGQALVYGLGTIGGNVAQGLFDNAGMDVAITADRAKDKQYLNRYADLIGADLVMKDGKYMLGYTPEQAKLAGLQEASSGYTYNDLRQMIGLEPTEKGDVDVENSILYSVVEALGYEKKQQDKTANEYYTYRTSNVTGLGGSSGTTDDTDETSMEDTLLDTGAGSTTSGETYIGKLNSDSKKRAGVS